MSPSIHVRHFFRRLIALFRAGHAESDLKREIDAHLQLLEDQFIARGMPPEEARYAARRAFGGVEQAKEHQREARSFRWLAGWPMDLKLGMRIMVKSPGLTIIAVIAMAVAIGGGAAYLEFVNDFFRPTLSFPGGDRLVGILNWDLARGDVEQRSLHEFALWKEQLTTVEELGAARQIEHNLVTPDGWIEPARGVEMSASAFRVVPVSPLDGRPFLDDDESPTAPPILLIGEDLWNSRFHSDLNIVGQTVRFGETVHTVVGVMPKAFGFPSSSSLWLPLRMDSAGFQPREGPPLIGDPAVINTTYAVHLPGGGNEFWLEFPPTEEGHAIQAAAEAKMPGDVLWLKSARVGTNYFETFQQPLVAGRLFTEIEVEGARDVAIVDESFVRDGSPDVGFLHIRNRHCCCSRPHAVDCRNICADFVYTRAPYARDRHSHCAWSGPPAASSWELFRAHFCRSAPESWWAVSRAWRSLDRVPKSPLAWARG